MTNVPNKDNIIVINKINEKNNFSSKKYMYVNACGRLSRCAYRIIRGEGRLDYHIVYVISGDWEAVYDNKKYSLKPGNFVFYYPNQPQNYYFFPYNGGCEVFWIHFSGSAVHEILNAINLEPGVYQCGKSEKITSIFSELVHEHNLNEPFSQSAQSALTIYLLTAFSRHITNTLNSKHNDMHTADLDINRVIMEMNENYTNEYNPEYYANICDMSISGFYHKFKRVIGVSPKKYFIKLKMEYTKELISFTNLSIKEIAAKFGYENPMYFSYVFKQATGLSPSEYRAKSNKSLK